MQKTTFNLSELKKQGFCPFRVQTYSYEAGCSLQYGNDTHCYTQIKKPLLFKDNYYICPKVNIKINQEIYQLIETLLYPLLKYQDEDEVAMNLRPVILGLSNPKIKANTSLGNDMVELAKKIHKELHNIIMNIK